MKRRLLLALAVVMSVASPLTVAVTTLTASPAGSITAPPETPVADLIGRTFTVARTHACAIRRDDTVWCWGQNTFGQLGWGPTGSGPMAPGQVDLGGRGAVDISAGQGSTCAVLDDATVWCWGRGVSGELGNGASSNSPVPVQVSMPEAVTQVAVGNPFACALTQGHQVFCWGSNLNGRLGIGDPMVAGENQPTGAVGLSQAAYSISAGNGHACAVLLDGSVGCWGDNSASQVAPGTTPQYAPYEFSVSDVCGAPGVLLGCSPPPGAVSVATGLQVSCAITADHLLYCWGDSFYGERTSGASGRKSEVVLDQADIDAGRYFVQVALGWKQACAMLEDGSVRCWGTNDLGEVGTNTGTGMVGVPTAVDLGADRAVMALHTSQNNTCALLTTGALQCWGAASTGIMANSSAVNVGDDETPGSVAPVGLTAPGVATRSFTATGTTQAEGDGAGTVPVTVRLNETLPWDETVTYSGPDGQTGTLSFPVGTTEASFSITYSGNTTSEADRTIDVVMTGTPMPWPGGALTLTLTNDDAATTPEAPATAAYRLVDAAGTVYSFGGLTSYGNATVSAPSTAVDIESTVAGYWVLLSDGSVQRYGDASFQAPVDTSVWVDGERAIRLLRTPTGDGYWIVTTKGRVQPTGDAARYGDVSALALNAPIVDAAVTSRGYYLLGADGGVFAFGPGFYGSTASLTLNAPVRAIVPTAAGYWLAAADGGVFSFGDAEFRGSMGGTALNAPVVAMTDASGGYVLVASDGGVFNFSNTAFAGSLGANPPATPVVAID